MRNLLLIAVLLVVGSVAYAQGTPDGETPAAEEACSGLMGAAFGLCNAYCEAMDCDSSAPQASATACIKVLDKFAKITGVIPPCETSCPCLDDRGFDLGTFFPEGYDLQCNYQGPERTDVRVPALCQGNDPACYQMGAGIVAATGVPFCEVNYPPLEIIGEGRILSRDEALYCRSLIDELAAVLDLDCYIAY